MKEQVKAQVISFHCVLKDPMGRVISSSFNNDVLTEALSGAAGAKAAKLQAGSPDAVAVSPTPAGYADFHEPLKGLVEGLQGLKKGEKRSIFVSAERAYGYYDPELVMDVPRRKLPHGEALEIGFQILTQASDGESRVFRIVAADAQTVTLDGNHPLAGQDLRFDIEATSTREATAEEIKQARNSPRPPIQVIH